MTSTKKSPDTERKGTLLIADDEQDLREILESALKPVADRIITADNGRDALEKVLCGGVDAVLTDIKMPFMTGLEFLAEVRGLGRELPVVILTAFGDRSNAVEALRLGATDFLEKPFDAEKLRKVMSQAIELGSFVNQADDAIRSLLADESVDPVRAGAIRQARLRIALIRNQWQTKARKAG